jgi:hypothetical protein
MTVSPEGLLLDSLDLNTTSGTYSLEAFDPGVALKRPEWVQGADSDGAALVRDPLVENRTVTAKVRIIAASMDAATLAIGAIVDKLEEAERQEDGLPLVWTPASGSKSTTFYVLSGEITGMPVDPTEGWFVSAPIVTVSLTCKPYGYASEVTGPSATGTTPSITLAVPSVGGDVPAEARLVITDGSGKSRRYVEWGLEQRFYNAGSPSSLILDSEDLVTTGFAGVQATRSGAYRRSGATHDTVAASLFSQPVAVCGTGNQPHIGTFRVKARVYASSMGVQLRLSWQDGDGPFSANDYAIPSVAANFAEVDLGLITIQPARSGTQRWTGRLEAFSSTLGDTIEIDYLTLIPAGEGYGKARASYAYRPGSIFAHDEFAGTGGTALNGRTAPAGGSWATSGATTDLAISGSSAVQRSTSSDSGRGRLAILGSTSSSDMQVGLTIAPSTVAEGLLQGVIARYVDANNYLRLSLAPMHSGPTNSFAADSALLILDQIVAGTITNLGSLTTGNGGLWTIGLIAYASGRLLGILFDASGVPLSIIDAAATVAATGGTLASGKSGFFDYNPATGGPTPTRTYTGFTVATPPPEPIALYANQSLEVHSDDTIRKESTGTYYGRVPSYRGSRLYLPPAGNRARTSRLLIKADRNDLEVAAHTPLGDSITAQIFYTPRSLVVPR